MAKRISLLLAVFSLVAASMALASSGSYAWQLTRHRLDGEPSRSLGRQRAGRVGERECAGTVLRTTNKGATWQSVGPPGTEALQFRDIEAFDQRTAVILSIGDTSDAFRIYRTTDAGQTWSLVFQNTEPTAFYDCMAFFDKHRGLALSDPINGRFRILATSDRPKLARRCRRHAARAAG